ncbi:MAG: hypothetical protein WD379_05750 [Dehalococcoidia bacterium]
MPQTAWRLSGPLLRAAAAGALVGAISAGVGARVVMRIIALANPDRDGVTTDAEATAGVITFDGTMNLLLLGVIAGIMGGAVYLGVRRWLPVPAAWKGLTYGIVTLLTVGQLLFDSANADFQIFEPVVMVIALFSVLFLLNGVILGAVLHRFQPEPAYPTSPRVSRTVTGVLVLVCVLGLVAHGFTTVQMIDDEGSCFSALGGGQGCAVRTADVEAP